MSEISDRFEPARADTALQSGTAGKWYARALGTDFTCTCGENFTVNQEHVGLSYAGDPPSKMEKTFASVAAKVGVDVNHYDVSEDTLEDGLFADDGTLVQGLILCPYCLYQNGHHHQRTKRHIPIPSQ